MTAETATAATAPLPVLVGFCAALRHAGLALSSGQVLTYCQAATRLDLGDAQDLYWAGRACLLSRREDAAAYDETFRRYYGGAGAGLRIVAHGTLPRPSIQDLPRTRPRRAPAPDTQEPPPAGARASAAEVLRHKRFTDCTPAELAALRALMAGLRLHPPLRTTRRTRPSPQGRHADLRRTLRRSLRSQGEVLRLSWRAPRTRPRRLVLLLDISGSMAGSSRALLQFAHSATARGGHTEVFCFGTRLTRITPQLRRRRPDEALAGAAAAVVDWEGGTRIGEAVDAFVRTWGRRGLARGAVVVICSDGLERGEPAQLAAAMARLARLAHRVVWVNPLKGDGRYQPLAGGMAAALPFVDVFVPGHNLSSLESLAAVLSDLRRPPTNR